VSVSHIKAASSTDRERFVLIDQGRALTRRQLDDAVDDLARELTRRGVATGDRVAWMMRNRAEVMVLALATQRIGAVVVPVSYRSSPPETERLLAFADAALVVVEDATILAVDALTGIPMLNIDDAARGPHPPSPGPLPELDVPDRFGAGASMLFTSGTTGAPRAVVRTKGDARLAEAIASRFGFDQETRYLASGPFYHSGPWTCALMVLSRGGVVAARPRFDARDWLAFACTHRINATFITPTQLRQLVSAVERGAAAPPLTDVVVSGESFPPELKRRAVAAFGRCFVDCYGCTELGPLTSTTKAELLERPYSCGTAFPGVEVAAFDGDEQLAPGKTGLLRARSPVAFDGYLDGGHTASDSVGDGWMTVADVGYVDGDGNLHIVGRADDMIISGGVNVFPADVEAVLVTHPGVHECAVFGLADRDWGETVCAAVVGPEPPSLEELRAWMRDLIADDKRPRKVFYVERLPRTATEKVSRRRLREMMASPPLAGPRRGS
jgi:acyl-coenzyme A synthetase/AMP-(fatty) acid ligase